MNGKDIANMIHNLKQISRSDVSGMMREQLRNSIIDECAQFVERKLEGYAIVKIEQAERMEALLLKEDSEFAEYERLKQKFKLVEKKK